VIKQSKRLFNTSASVIKLHFSCPHFGNAYMLKYLLIVLTGAGNIANAGVLHIPTARHQACGRSRQLIQGRSAVGFCIIGFGCKI
jgi:hypothetical protein